MKTLPELLADWALDEDQVCPDCASEFLDGPDVPEHLMIEVFGCPSHGFMVRCSDDGDEAIGVFVSEAAAIEAACEKFHICNDYL